MSTETLRTRYPLKKEKIIKKTLLNILLPLLFTLILTLLIVVWGSNYVIPLVIIFLFLLFTGVCYWYQKKYYMNYFYDLTGEGLVISKGVFSSKKTIVPPFKIQDIYLDQDLLDRFLGLWDLHISSASDTSGFEAHIDGLSEADGRTIKDILLSRVLKRPDTAQAKADVFYPEKSGMILSILRPFLGAILLLFFFSAFGVIFIAFAVLSIPLSILEYRAIRYELRDNGVFIRKGFITPKESLFIYRNIQDVEENYDLWSQIFGLRNLSIKTMTSLSAKDAVLFYLKPEDSKRYREEILRRSRQGVKDSVEPEKSQKAEIPISNQEVVQQIAETEETPYKNHLLKGAIYAGACMIMPLAAFALIALVASGLNLITMLPALFMFIFVLFVIFLIAPLIQAAIMLISYNYEMSPRYVKIKMGILNVQNRQIDYRKLQDVILHISFPQSFAGLGTIRLDTGSKEVARGKSRAIGSVSTLIESIPDLEIGDANSLKNKIADYIGISLKQALKEPLVKRIPLESIKPVKKTLWWVIYLTPILAIILILPLAGLDGLKVFALLAYIALIAGKYLYELYYLKGYFYDTNNDVLIIKKGVFGTKEIIIPYSRIQDVFVDQDLLDRFFGLKDVYVSTVTGRSILNAHIDGVSTKNAETIARLLLDNTIKR